MKEKREGEEDGIGTKIRAQGPTWKRKPADTPFAVHGFALTLRELVGCRLC